MLDTASAYDTEAVVGKAIKGVPREQVVIATKSSVFRGGERLTPEEVIASLDNSLRELGIDCIDVFQLHAVPPSRLRLRARRDRAGAAETRRRRGKFRFLGITETSPNDLEHEMLLRAVPDGHLGRGDGGVPHDEPEHPRGRVPGDADSIASARC